MNYNKKIKALKKVFIDDGMGGGEYQYQDANQEVKCSIAPIKKKIIEAGGREIEHNLLKVFTKDQIIGEDLLFDYQGDLYKVASWCDYGKVFLYEMEVL